MQTKGTMTKDLKAAGIRKAEKYTGETVQLEHLKTYEIVELWYKYCLKATFKNGNALNVISVSDKA